jgi:hypothetical protein
VSNPYILPESLRGFIAITEIDDVRLGVEALFRRKFEHPPPATPHHLGAFHLGADGSARLLCYSHMLPFGDLFLSGGSCTDGDVYRAMPAAQREALAAAGGPWHHVLKFAFAKFADRCEAFFGYSGDERALAVCRAVDFLPTGHPHLIVHWHKPLHEVMQRALVAKAHAIGPF